MSQLEHLAQALDLVEASMRKPPQPQQPQSEEELTAEQVLKSGYGFFVSDAGGTRLMTWVAPMQAWEVMFRPYSARHSKVVYHGPDLQEALRALIQE